MTLESGPASAKWVLYFPILSRSLGVLINKTKQDPLLSLTSISKLRPPHDT